MIHLTGAMGRDANDAVVHAVAAQLECAYRVTRRGWPSSEVSRPLLPLNPLNGGAPGTDGSSARTGVAIAALSLEAGGVSRTREADSRTSSDRATDGAGLEGVAGGACTAAGPGARAGVAGCGSTSGSRERSIRGRGAGAARRTSLLGAGGRGVGGRLTTSLPETLESTDGFARSGVGAITGGAVGTGARAGASLRSSRAGALLSSTGLQSVELPLSAMGIARSATAAMLARTARGRRRSPRARATRS
jgi:hypothetical protein